MNISKNSQQKAFDILTKEGFSVKINDSEFQDNFSICNNALIPTSPLFDTKEIYDRKTKFNSVQLKNAKMLELIAIDILKENGFKEKNNEFLSL